MIEIYSATKYFPPDERNNLTSQMRRAAVSIPSNISEGCGKSSNPALKVFLGHSLGSSYELETQIIISNKLGYISEEQYTGLNTSLTSIQRMRNKLIDTL